MSHSDDTAWADLGQHVRVEINGTAFSGTITGRSWFEDNYADTLNLEITDTEGDIISASLSIDFKKVAE